MARHFAIIPVIELEPGAYSKQTYALPNGTGKDLPEQWEAYNQKCYQDAGLKHLKAIETGQWLFELAQIEADHLKIIFPEIYADYLNDETNLNELFEDMKDLAPSICGGFALKDADQIIHLPACCCGLESIEEWQVQPDTSIIQVWTGHDQEDEVVLEFSTSGVILSVGKAKRYSFSKAEYRTLLSQAETTIHHFIERSATVLNPLFNIKNGRALAEAMIYR